MKGNILLIEGRRWRLVQPGEQEHVPRGEVADILFGDYDRARAEETAADLRRHLPANGLHVVRSGCEAMEFLRGRGTQCGRGLRVLPVLAMLDEDLSGMAGHSILRSIPRLPALGEILIIVLVGAGRAVIHRQWLPEPDGYLEKPFAFIKLRDCIRFFGESAAPACIPPAESPA